MTTLTGIELSKKVAELYGIDAASDRGLLERYWLHEDSARCFELACRYSISMNPLPPNCVGAKTRTVTVDGVTYFALVERVITTEEYPHWDIAQMQRVAILMNLERMGLNHHPSGINARKEND